ncbi:MAG: hypothetical protein M3R04_10170 [bacterium]|nr:hypothetical protein [bacterium]
MQDIALVKTLSMAYLFGLVTMTLASLLFRAIRPRLASQQRADAGFGVIFGTFCATWLLAFLIWLGVVREVIIMSTRMFHMLMHGGWGAVITAAGGYVMALSLLLATFLWLRGRTPRSQSEPLSVVSGLTVVANSGISTAGLVGCWRPAVWVNPQYWERLSEAERLLALAHERTHLRRRDNLRKLLLQFASALYAVLPFSRRWASDYELDCELAVDDRCRRENDAQAYASLVGRSAQFALTNFAGAGVTSVRSGMSQADLRVRLGHLTAPCRPSSAWATPLVLAAVITALAPAAALLSHSVTRCLLACYLGY